MQPGEDGAEGDDVGVLDPEDLDITDDERVLEFDDGRYIIASGDESLDEDVVDVEAVVLDADDEAGEPEAEETEEAESTDDPHDEESATEASIASEDVIQGMRDRVRGANSLYGFDVTAKFEGDVDRRELYSNDVVTTFENLLVWFAQHIGGDTPVEEVIGILLVESNVPVRYPGIALERLVEESGLATDAEIAELLDYAERDQGIRFPP